MARDSAPDGRRAMRSVIQSVSAAGVTDAKNGAASACANQPVASFGATSEPQPPCSMVSLVPAGTDSSRSSIWVTVRSSQGAGRHSKLTRSPGCQEVTRPISTAACVMRPRAPGAKCKPCRASAVVSSSTSASNTAARSSGTSIPMRMLLQSSLTAARGGSCEWRVGQSDERRVAAPQYMQAREEHANAGGALHQAGLREHLVRPDTVLRLDPLQAIALARCLLMQPMCDALRHLVVLWLIVTTAQRQEELTDGRVATALADVV